MVQPKHNIAILRTHNDNKTFKKESKSTSKIGVQWDRHPHMKNTTVAWDNIIEHNDIHIRVNEV